MTPNNEIANELKNIAPVLSAIGNANLYTTPTDYFDNFTSVILQKINSEATPAYHLPKASLAFTVPENYFEHLPQTILQKIKNTQGESEIFIELESIAPLLNSISKEQVYTVPQGYFEQTIQPVNAPAKVISFGWKSVYKYAVAAVIATILAIGLFLILGKENADNSGISKATNAAVKNLSEDDIASFLSATSTDDNTAASAAGNNDVHEAVKQMSDEEINQFLAEAETHEDI